jgi:ABC-type glycerol-3-phosphate transport system permease component
MSGFFEGIPMEMEEAGVIDGCNRWQVFGKLVLPLSKPGVASAAIFTFINSWNEYMMANIFVKNDNMRTLPVGLTMYIQQFTSEWGSLMAASTITLIPAALFLIFAQKYVVQGLTAGAVKG